LTLTLSTTLALAQPDPMTASAPPKATSPKPAEKPKPASGDDQALAGPKVDRPAGEKTIVERSFDGTLVRLETRPEQAAVALLTLTDDQKQPINKLFEDRAKKLSTVLYENLDTFLAVQAARQAGGGRPSNDPKDREEIAGKMRELHKAGAEAGLIEPPLVDQVAKLLPEDQTPEFRRLVSEYMTAVDQQAQKDFGANPQGSFSRPGNPTPDGPRRATGDQRTQMNLFIRELARTLGAVVQERKEQAEALFKAVDATPEQQTQIQNLLRETGEKNKGKRPTPEQRAETFKKIMDLLTPEQRALAREHLRPPE
jgi:Spy/CpxP family protein refolding chaperone